MRLHYSRARSQPVYAPRAPALLTILSEERNQALSQGVTEHELGSNDENLGRKTLEEGSHTLGSDHFTDNGHSADLRVEVGVLDSSLRG